MYDINNGKADGMSTNIHLLVIGFVIITVNREICFCQSVRPEEPNDSLRFETGRGNGGGTAVPLLSGWYLRSYGSGLSGIVAEPGAWSWKDWLIAGTMAGAGGLLYMTDQSIHDYIQAHRTPFPDAFFSAVTCTGDKRFLVPLLTVLSLSDTIVRLSKLRVSGLLGLKSVTLSWVLTTALKHSAHRHRPSSGDPHTIWDGWGFSRANQSFPSGHSAAAFSTAAVFASVYKGNKPVQATAYGLASLVALSRINNNAHWSSDVFAGSVIGWHVAQVVMYQWNNQGILNVGPGIDGNSVKVTLTVPLKGIPSDSCRSSAFKK